MAPFTQTRVPTPTNVISLAAVTTTYPPSIVDSSYHHIEFQDLILSICILAAMFGFIVGIILFDLIRKLEPKRWNLKFTSSYLDKARAAFTKTNNNSSNDKGDEKSPERAPDTISGFVPEATNNASEPEEATAEGKNDAVLTLGPMTDVDILVTPFEVPFTESPESSGPEA